MTTKGRQKGRILKHGDSTINTGTFELMLEEYAGAAKMGYGYNPYEIPNLKNPSTASRKADLRRLSEWIRTKKHVEQLKKSDEEPLP
jgi:hypothetical protein